VEYIGLKRLNFILEIEMNILVQIFFCFKKSRVPKFESRKEIARPKREGKL